MNNSLKATTTSWMRVLASIFYEAFLASSPRK